MSETRIPQEMVLCQTPVEQLRDAIADVEIYIYESWESATITKDAARRFVAIAEIFGWTMPWVDEMREWSK